jgi:hypothetical protein
LKGGFTPSLRVKPQYQTEEKCLALTLVFVYKS